MNLKTCLIVLLILTTSKTINAARKAPTSPQETPVSIPSPTPSPVKEPDIAPIEIPISNEPIREEVINEIKEKVAEEEIKKIENKEEKITDQAEILKEVTAEAQAIEQSAKDGSFSSAEKSFLAKAIEKAKGFGSDLLNKIKANKFLAGASAISATIIGLLIVKLSKSRSYAKELAQENARLKTSSGSNQKLQKEFDTLAENVAGLKGMAEREKYEAVNLAKKYIKSLNLDENGLNNLYTELKNDSRKRIDGMDTVYEVLGNTESRRKLANKGTTAIR